MCFTFADNLTLAVIEENFYKEYNIWQPLLLSLMCILGIMLGYKMNEADDPALILGVDKEESHELSAIGRVEEIVRFVEARYVDEVDDGKLVESAITAVLDQLDPHSIYIGPDYLKSINNNMEGRYDGIGIESFYLDDTVNIISVMKNSPASKAGLETFDQILSIDGEVVAGVEMPFDSISLKLKKGGTEKNVLIKKHNTGDIKEIAIQADELPLVSVSLAYMLNDDTGVIKVNRFSSKTYKEFMDHLEDLYENEGLKNVIIDLRGNPGGYLPEATNILSQLIQEKDRLLVYTEGKNNKKTEYYTTGKSFFNIERVAVITDESSASASEILAGAIQDWDRGLVVGRRTFGKGLVQEQYDLSNGGAIRLTVAKYYTPTGRSIQQSYEDLEKYHDVTNRLTQDSTKVKDSMEYRTMFLGRKVFAGGGISPDVLVQPNTKDQDPAYQELISFLPEYVFRMLKDAKVNTQYALADIQQWTLTDSEWTDLEKYLDAKGIHFAKSYLRQYKSDIMQELRWQYLDIKYGDNEAYRFRNIADEHMLEAIKYTSSDKPLQDYLTTRN